VLFSTTPLVVFPSCVFVMVTDSVATPVAELIGERDERIRDERHEETEYQPSNHSCFHPSLQIGSEHGQ
jgi:hypothetical protein